MSRNCVILLDGHICLLRRGFFMGKNRATYDVVFKKKAVDLYLKESMGYKTVAKELGIDHSVVRVGQTL